MKTINTIAFQCTLHREDLNGTWKDIFHTSVCCDRGWECTGGAASLSVPGAGIQRMSV